MDWEQELADFLTIQCEADAECGEHDFGVGVGFLFQHWEGEGGYITVRTPDGKCSIRKVARSTDELRAEWLIVQAELDMGRDEPEPGDYVIEHDRVSQYGEVIFQGPEHQDQMQAIRSHSEATNYHPDVWLLSDHGNYHKLI